MVVDIVAAVDAPDVGAKARTLGRLRAQGFNVPPARVVPGHVLDDVLRHSGVADTARRLLRGLTKDDVDRVARELDEALAGLRFPDGTLRDVLGRLAPGRRYAVRSSGAREDLERLSFAGQYETCLDVERAAVPAAILRCYRSLFSATVLHYLLDNGMAPDTTGMSVIVQEMVAADLSGVAFTVNPVTGADTEIVVEAARGLGDAVVSGHVTPQRYVYDWYRQRDRTAEAGGPRGDLLTPAELRAIGDQALRIQRHFGYPCDVEFAMRDGELFVLQARPITRIGYAGIADQWTTADFKDGGVSATVCTPYMWSLYEYVWEIELRRFLLASRIVDARDLRKLGRMYYGRPYWNLSVAKAGMARVPGYRERRFDTELGVRITYPGDGQVTRVTPRSLLRVARIALAMRKITAERRANAEALKASLLATYREYHARRDADLTPQELRQTWYRLVTVDYLRSEGTYFWQIFINTIQQALNAERIVAVAGNEGYLTLIGGLDDISHLKPFHEMWGITREIRDDPAALRFWTDTDPAAVEALLRAGGDEHHLDKVRAFIDRYGYHSAKELDVTYPDYAEDHAAVVAMVADTVGLDDGFSPMVDRAKLTAAYEAELERIREQVTARGPGGRRRFAKIRDRIERTRRMLWWREEYRDVSTHFYHLIRIYTLRLATLLCESGDLAEPSDVWFATMRDLCDFIDGAIDRRALRAIVARNRAYHESFRNYLSENEIGAAFDTGGAAFETGGAAFETGGSAGVAAAGGAAVGVAAAGVVRGVGGNAGTVSGTARVIAGLDEIGRLRPGDILVTRFTDTGWTSKFAMLSGIVTEYGGILCHAAIVSREYGIPCVVCATGATSRIADGSPIRVDGLTGEVTVLAGAAR